MRSADIAKIVMLSLAVGTAAIGTATSLDAMQNIRTETVTLLTAQFDPREVVKIEGGDFHFAPGQVAPVHRHHAPAVGYVAKGHILYQVEGGQPVILSEGEAFYEPTDHRILRFDNASATHEAIFVDFNFQQAGEPFIDFEQSPAEHIDRRAFETAAGFVKTVSSVHVAEITIAADDLVIPDAGALLVAYVAEGVVEVRTDGAMPAAYSAGDSIALGDVTKEVVLANPSATTRSKLIIFSAR
ncbi:cupin domain-containing protein [Roseobacter sp. YSTF-M11]|uniref:Cupin domain-containing protein n=1 Tax=Roseobacter insulae TaxID=2859783 RepID=A0A9X1FY84_9RHOB|nr:cupin domain-containing protein [Roseobacter insulae]MBW4710330.1 cupin domain-containing protein [Roseobacter insulae]